jgi:hypothetical protein
LGGAGEVWLRGRYRVGGCRVGRLGAVPGVRALRYRVGDSGADPWVPVGCGFYRRVDGCRVGRWGLVLSGGV